MSCLIDFSIVVCDNVIMFVAKNNCVGVLKLLV